MGEARGLQGLVALIPGGTWFQPGLRTSTGGHHFSKVNHSFVGGNTAPEVVGQVLGLNGFAVQMKVFL